MRIRLELGRFGFNFGSIRLRFGLELGENRVRSGRGWFGLGAVGFQVRSGVLFCSMNRFSPRDLKPKVGLIRIAMDL